jgi:4'-phosphopantetheinyl transferase
MPPERQQRALRYRREIDKRLCVCAYWLLLHGLKKECGIIMPLLFVYGENGKPYLADNSGIFFNLSHCKEGLVCAISENEVGVDIQDVRLLNMNVAKRICTVEELEKINQSNHPERLFCEIWTIKESFIKQQGGSIAQPLNTFNAHAIFEQANVKGICYWGESFHLCCIGESKINKVHL